MKASEKRLIVRDYVFSREGKNSYTQSSKRTQVDYGFSDCSSLQQRAYKEIGIDIGSYTGAQIVKGEWVQLGGSLPAPSKLKIGDELFFAAGYNNGRPYNVGHIEMYVGNGEISGHGSGTGPTRKDMLAYCRQRNAAGKPFIGVKRYIKDDPNETIESGNNALSKEFMFVGECTGNDVNVRTGPGTDYHNIPVWPKLDKGNLVDVLEKMGSWYLIRIAGRYEGYIYADYVKKHEEEQAEPKEDDTMEILSRIPQWVGKATTQLNVRSWAGKENPRIKSWPQLAKGNLVDVCDTVEAADGSDWYYIRIDGRIYGFASAKYIEKV